MAGEFTDYLEGKVLDHVLAGSSYIYPQPSLYIALSKDLPDESGINFNEPAQADSYARVPYSGGWSGAGSPSGVRTNAGVVMFPQATGNWGEIKAFGIFDSSTVGSPNLLMWGELTPYKTINNGDQAAFAVGALQVNLD